MKRSFQYYSHAAAQPQRRCLGVAMACEGVHIRPAKHGDLGAIAEIFAYYVRSSAVTFAETPPPVTDWQRRFFDLKARQLPILVAMVNGKVAGYAYAGPWRPKPAYRHTVDTAYLAPERTGQGLRRLLLDDLLTGLRPSPPSRGRWLRYAKGAPAGA